MRAAIRGTVVAAFVVFWTVLINAINLALGIQDWCLLFVVGAALGCPGGMLAYLIFIISDDWQWIERLAPRGLLP